MGLNNFIDKPRFTIRHVILFLLSPISVIVFFVLVIKAENPSGWIQALGSIFAVLGAGTFPYIHAKRIHMEKRYRRLHILGLIMNQVSHEIFTISNVFSGVSGDTDEITRSFGEAYREYLITGRNPKVDVAGVVCSHIDKERKKFRDGHKAAYIKQRHAMLQSLALEGVYTSVEASEIFRVIDVCRDAITLLELDLVISPKQRDDYGRLALACSATCERAARYIELVKMDIAVR